MTAFTEPACNSSFSKYPQPSSISHRHGREFPCQVPADLPSCPRYIVDGLNIAYANTSSPKLEIVITLAIDLAIQKLPFIFVFDGNAGDKFRTHQSGQHEAAYKTLIREFDASFIAVQGIKADQLILHAADCWQSSVVSDDTFREYENLPAPTELVKVNTILDLVLIGNILLRIESNLDSGMTKLMTLLKSRQEH